MFIEEPANSLKKKGANGRALDPFYSKNLKAAKRTVSPLPLQSYL